MNFKSDSASSTSSSHMMASDKGEGSSKQILGEARTIMPLWTTEELKVLMPFRVEWPKMSDRKAKQTLVDKAVGVLFPLRPQGKRDALKKAVRGWLAHGTKKMNEGARPTIRKVVQETMKTEILQELKEKKGLGKDDTVRFTIDEWSKAASQVQKRVTEDPEALKKVQKQAKEWQDIGMPDKIKKLHAEKHYTKTMRDFSNNAFRAMGARTFTLMGFVNSNDDVITSFGDYNSAQGANVVPGFLEDEPELFSAICTAWDVYCEKVFSIKPGDTRAKATAPIIRDIKKQGSAALEYTEEGDPLLPDDCLEMPLKQQKHLMRSFLRILYTLATGRTQDDKECAPPWDQMVKEPHQFYFAQYGPEDIGIRDPSKMKNDEIVSVLRHWKGRQDAGEIAFRFHQIYRRNAKEPWVKAVSPTPCMDETSHSEEQDTVDEEERPKWKVRRVRKNKWKGKKRNHDTTEEEDSPRPSESPRKKYKGKEKMVDTGRWEDSEGEIPMPTVNAPKAHPRPRPRPHSRPQKKEASDVAAGPSKRVKIDEYSDTPGAATQFLTGGPNDALYEGYEVSDPESGDCARKSSPLEDGLLIDPALREHEQPSSSKGRGRPSTPISLRTRSQSKKRGHKEGVNGPERKAKKHKHNKEKIKVEEREQQSQKKSKEKM